MIANYHTHTYLCKHASGTPQSYVEAAIQCGIKVLGFSDHVPYPFSNGHVSGFRMDVSELETYATEILRLKELYKNRLQIYLGYEAEFYPKEFDRMLSLIKKFPCDYLILGQHCLQNEYDGFYSGNETIDEEYLIQYVDQVIAGMKTLKFSYLAHPDLINFQGDESVYTQYMKKLCQNAKELSIPLELNLLGLKEHRHYPRDAFWRVVKEVGNDVVIGYDAHRADAFCEDIRKKAMDYLERYGITPLEKIEFLRV